MFLEGLCITFKLQELIGLYVESTQGLNSYITDRWLHAYVHGPLGPVLHFRVIRACMAATLMPKSNVRGFPVKFHGVPWGVAQLPLEAIALEQQCGL